MGDAGTTALRALLAVLVAALLAAAVDPAEPSGLRALGAGRRLAPLAAAVGDTEATAHDAGGAALHRTLLAAAVRDAESAALGCLLALRKPQRRECVRAGADAMYLPRSLSRIGAAETSELPLLARIELTGNASHEWRGSAMQAGKHVVTSSLGQAETRSKRDISYPSSSCASTVLDTKSDVIHLRNAQ